MVQNYIDKIVMSNDNNKMKQLENVLVDTIGYIKHTDKDVYCRIETDLYEIAEGKILTEEKAKEWVSQMEPKAMWTLNEVSQLKAKHNSSMPLIPLYIIMNMLFSDLGDVIGEDMTDDVIEKYIKAAADWYYDEDATNTEDKKLFYYWKYIVN